MRTVPLHLAVHVLGLAVAAGLALLVLVERRMEPGGRIGIVLGAMLLAASHLGIGALLVEPDGPVLLVRAAGYAALAVGAAGRLVGGTAVVAVLPPVAHLAAAAAGLAASVATARGVLGRGRNVAPLAGGVGLWAVADLLAGVHGEVAATVSLAGSAAAGSWLLRRAADRSLAGRLAGVFLLVLLVLTVGLAGASGLVFTADLRDQQTERLATMAEAQAQQLASGGPREQESTAALLAGPTLVREIDEVAAGERDHLDSRARAVAELPGVDVVVLIDRDGVVVGSALRGEPVPAADQVVLTGDPVVAAALDGSTSRGLVSLGDGRLVAVGAAPVAPTQEDGSPALDRQVGVLATGRLVTDQPELESIAADTAADVALVVDGRVAASTLPRSLDRQVTAAPEAGEVFVDGRRRLAATAALASGPFEPAMGGLVLILPPGAFLSAADTALRSVFLVAAAGLLAAGALAVAASRWITRPVGVLTDAAEHVARGDLTTRVRSDRRDEVGRLAAVFDRMTGALAAREQELRDAAATQASLRARLEAVTASMGEALLASDLGGNLVTANPAAGDLLGRTSQELTGLPLREVVVGEAEGGQDLLAVLGGPDVGDTRTGRGRLGTDGPLVAALATPLVDDGGIVGRVYVLRDITSEVEAERLKTEIIANVSHELRTPLTPIRGYLDLLRHRDLGSEQVREFAEQAAEATGRLQRTVDALIDLADLEAGRVVAEPERLPVDSIVDKALKRWREHAPDRQLARRVRRGLPDVAVDPRLILRALDALIENALKFSEGPVRLLADLDGDHVRLTVRDRGEGIAPERLADVLQDFRQADGSATRHVGGLGLGLAIVQRVLARSHAEFDLASTPGRGTDASLLLPVAPL